VSIRTTVTNPGIYFLTFTCHNWLPLIDLTSGYDLIYNWFDVFSKKGHTLNGYVIMPNHLHLLMHYAGGSQSLNSVVGNGKRFMAYDIIKRLNNQNEYELLTVTTSCSIKRQKQGKKARSMERFV